MDTLKEEDIMNSSDESSKSLESTKPPVKTKITGDLFLSSFKK